MSAQPHQPLRLCFHIGAGKTGSTSIQQTLARERAHCLDQGVDYLGLMGEHLPAPSFAWQHPAGEPLLSQLPPEMATRQFRKVLRQAVKSARERGLHTLVWSNEAFFDQYAHLLAPLAELVEQGVDVRILAYLRNHEDWAQSAYLQWGMKHKRQPGPVPCFADFIAQHPPQFATTLQAYDQVLPGRLRLRNYDQCTDVVTDCLTWLGLASLASPATRANRSPNNVEMLMQGLYNDRMPDAVLPSAWQRAVGVHTLGSSDTPSSWLGERYPGSDELLALSTSVAPDRALVNDMLQAAGQPPLTPGAALRLDPQVNESVLLMSLTRLCMAQARRLQRLEQQVASLTRPAVDGD